mgnify:CR=1 FL=1
MRCLKCGILHDRHLTFDGVDRLRRVVVHVDGGLEGHRRCRVIGSDHDGPRDTSGWLADDCAIVTAAATVGRGKGCRASKAELPVVERHVDDEVIHLSGIAHGGCCINLHQDVKEATVNDVQGRRNPRDVVSGEVVVLALLLGYPTAYGISRLPHQWRTVAIVMVATWIVSVAIRDASIVDPVWPAGFVAVAWVTHLRTEGDPVTGGLLVAMTTIWGVRLGAHLAWRRRGGGEDFRYQAMRRHWGARFWLVSLVTVFTLQGVLMWVVSLPVQLGLAASGAAPVVVLVVGAVIWAVGFAFETIEIGRAHV